VYELFGIVVDVCVPASPQGHYNPAEHISDAAKDLFCLFDKDNSGSITVQEFIDGLRSFKVDLSEDDMTVLVEELDEDRSGDIALEEFEKLMRMQA